MIYEIYDGQKGGLICQQQTIRVSRFIRMWNGTVSGAATRTDITRITRRLGDDIGRVYGWTFPQRKSTKKQA